MSTINRLCQHQGWSDARVVQLAVEYLESEGLLHSFLEWLQAVAEAENQEYSEGATCNVCGSDLDHQGNCCNPECRNYDV